MIKTLKTAAFSLTLFLACSSVALADGSAFTPLNFDDASYNVPKTTSATSATTATDTQTLVGNSRMQNAILELDGAQVDVRNQLLDYKAKYSDVDTQYNLIKAERKVLNKQVKSIERRIRQIDRAKEDIKRNML